jgi:hypothetical protein
VTALHQWARIVTERGLAREFKGLLGVLPSQLSLPGTTPTRPCILEAELDVLVHEIADRLHATPAGWSRAEALPGHFGELVGLAIAAAEEIEQRRFREILHRRLRCPRRHEIGCATVVDQRVGAEDKATLGRVAVVAGSNRSYSDLTTA